MQIMERKGSRATKGALKDQVLSLRSLQLRQQGSGYLPEKSEDHEALLLEEARSCLGSAESVIDLEGHGPKRSGIHAPATF